MIYITQLIYLKTGQEALFHQFEDLAIPIIANYNGKLLLRVRPTEATIVEHTLAIPYEIHLVEFDSDQDFENFKKDKTREQFLHLKEESIQAVLLIKGSTV